MRSDGNITPFPALTVSKRTLAGGEMAVVVVQPSDAPPVRLRGRVWVRVGPRRDMQRFGFGIPIAREALEKNGNPTPEFDVEPSHVLVTVRTRP